MRGYAGEPVWPNGYVGSISHCRSLAIAVVASSVSPITQIGVDVEEAEPLDPSLWDSICTPGEMRWLRDQTTPSLWAKVLFSIKEAAFKAHYPLIRRAFDFQDFEVRIEVGTNTCAVEARSVPLDNCSCRFAVGEEHILAFATTTVRT